MTDKVLPKTLSVCGYVCRQVRGAKDSETGDILSQAMSVFGQNFFNPTEMRMLP
jgi:hypothetical protein